MFYFGVVNREESIERFWVAAVKNEQLILNSDLNRAIVKACLVEGRGCRPSETPSGSATQIFTGQACRNRL